MSTRPLRLLATLLAFGLVAAACGDDDEGVSSEGGGSGSDFLACEVTDTGGVDDRSFNETAYKGLADAAEEVGFEPAVLESDTEADFEPNIQAHLDNGCDLIVTVGFLLGDATAAAAEANPGTEFAIVDFDFYDSDADEDVTYDNVRELTFATDEAAFLAGYLAAAMTETGKVGTYGGLNIPTVTIFMKGFQAGIEFYNDENDTDVELIGWDSADPDGGSFTGDFENQTNGRQTTETLLDADVDIIMPVAGPVGLGTIEAVEADGGD
ncbi:MAG: BMP family ABC transporter substrate-binding protein, partial [Acidimicrobiia bacterium]